MPDELPEPETQPANSTPPRMNLRRALRNAGFLLTGNALSYVLSLLTVVVVARPLGPEGYGEFNVILAFVGVFGWSALGGFDRVVVRDASGDEERLESLFRKVSGLKIAVGSAAMFACIVAAWLWPGYTEGQRIGITLASATLVISPVMGVVNSVFQVHEQMQWMAISGLVRQGAYIAIAGVAMFVAGPDPLPVVVAFVVAYVLALTFAWSMSRRWTRPRVDMRFWLLDRPVVTSGLVFTFIKFFSFLYTKIDVLLIDAFSSTTQVGLYAAAMTVYSRLNSSMEMLANAFFPQIVKRAKQGELRLVDMRKGMWALLAASGAVAIAATLALPFLIPLVLGKEYADAVPAAQLLMWGLAINAPFIPLTLMLQARGLERTLAVAAPVRAALNVVLDVIALAVGWGITGVAGATLVASAAYYAALMILGWRAGVLTYEGAERR